METVKFKTNIKCGGCVTAVTPFLNEAVGAGNWQVDTLDPNRTLTVQNTTVETVKRAIQNAGYKADVLN